MFITNYRLKSVTILLQVKSILLKLWRSNEVLFVNKMWRTTVLILLIWYVRVCVIHLGVPKIKCTAVSGCAPVFHENTPTHSMHTD